MSESDSLQTVHVYAFSVFRLDVSEGLSAKGEPVKLPPKVLQTLTYFVENPGRLITKNELFDAVWADSFVEDGALSFNISRLRKALAEYDKDTEFIETVSKRGFRFLAKVRKVRPENGDIEILIERHELRELVHEEETDLDIEPKSESILKPAKLTRTRIKTAIFAVVTLLMIVAGVGFFLNRKEKNELRSYDSMRSTDFTSWNVSGSSVFGDYNSSHNGNMVAYSSNEDGMSEGIFVKQLNGGEDLRLTNDPWVNATPIWSLDDQLIAYASVREAISGIYSIPSLGGTPKLIKVLGRGDLLLRSWSKDGSAIFYEFNGNLFRIVIETEEISQITDFPWLEFRRHFEISQDETQIVYCDEVEKQKDLWILSIGGGEAVRLTNDEDVEYRPGWHPDGKRIFYSVQRGEKYEINVVNTSGGKPVEITRGGGRCELINVSWDGKKIFYLRWLDKSNIWAVNTETGEELAIASEPESEFWPDISPDGRSIAFQSNPAEFVPTEINKSSVVVRRADGQIQNLFQGYGQKWLPDNRNIAFLRWNEPESKYNLWLFDTVSEIKKQITADGVAAPIYAIFPYHRGQVSDFDWGPDAVSVVYPDSARRNIRVTFTGDDRVMDLTRNDDPQTSYYSPIWSPDGKGIAYMSQTRPATPGEKTLRRVWISENGIERKIFETTKSMRFLGWSASGESLYFEAASGPMKAGFIDVELLNISIKGEGRTIAPLENISALSASLSPDGDRVAFIARVEKKEYIYTASTSNGDLKRVLSNPDPGLRLGVVTWSPDGKTIFVDKQEELNIISMFENFK